MGGRKKGSLNKATAGLKVAFQKHEKELVKGLLALTKSKDLNIRLKALQACLDRGWGKSPQPMTGEDGGGPAILRVEHVIVDPRNQNSDG
ncbi:hypothetical protein LCGC14_2794620 [marine sediment metagenome]|uniref:Uncharacterized protein n=1 Tax=marine sediment metagenome TaxID=412755 RepID=A0A0F8ZBJ9_9ZZZZ